VEALYKQTDGGLLYWQGWHHRNLVSAIAGRVGERAKAACHYAPDEPSAAAEVEAATAAKRAEGYAAIAIVEYHQVVVQWRRDTWASVADLAWRDEVEAVFDEALESTGLGFCDGGTFGGHKVQVFCLVVDVELGAREMVAALREVERLDGAVMAIRVGEDYRVVSPPGYRGPFSIL
jgi:hypothetical protein